MSARMHPPGCHSERGLCTRKLLFPGVAVRGKRIVRTAEVTIETEEKTLLHTAINPQCRVLWCPRCQRDVEMVTPECAAQIAGVSVRTVYRWIEARTIHFREEKGHLFICHLALPRIPSVLAGRTT